LARSVAMYGVYETERWVRRKQSVPIRRRDGIVQRYWTWKETKIVIQERGRYEFYGRGRDLYEAIRIATRRPPNKYVDVDARVFIRNPKKYSVNGVWVHYDINS
jgi:hypothetical protein